MNNKEFSKSLEKRTLDFGIRVLKLSEQIKYSPESKVIRNQLSKASTSIGANYHEANRSRSKADFANKIRISEGEANETVYWLETLIGMNWLKDETVETELKEARELLAIFTKISSSLR